MNHEHNNSGILFKNSKKTGDKQPDYRGNCVINNVEMDMAAWVRTGSKSSFMTFKFSEPYKKEKKLEFKSDLGKDDMPF